MNDSEPSYELTRRNVELGRKAETRDGKEIEISKD
ncbi:MAG: hypothetical protein M2R45_01328 [Verrucomicrobia subdivision 3 bacterium]|nr:hypothetical protein [Limisphaerales bacterium]MCS1415194.1 hypothetical protein [Limisphaerales bacterium]